MLVALGAVVAAAASLGVLQAPSATDQAHQGLHTAMQATIGASGYTEHYKVTNQLGSVEYYLVFQAPDRLSGYQTVAGRRSYVSAEGTTYYQGLTVSASTGPAGTRYVAQLARPVSAIDPVQRYLPVILRAADRSTDMSRAGDLYTFDGPQGTHMTVTVTGPYATSIVAQRAGATVVIEVSRIDSSPPAFVPSPSMLIHVPTSVPAG